MAGLKLGDTAIVSADEELEIKRASDILEEVRETVTHYGIIEYPQPEGSAPSLGRMNVEALSNAELGQFYTTYVAYAMYLVPRVAEVTVAHRISTSNLAQIAARLEASLTARGVPKALIKAKIKNNAVWREQELEHLKLFATKTILEAHARAYSGQAKALSRVIELRKIELESQLRDHNVGNARTSRGAYFERAASSSRGTTVPPSRSRK